MIDSDALMLQNIREIINAKVVTCETKYVTNVYGIPKYWIAFIKEERHASASAYIRAALREKLERDGMNFSH
ncbi:MAG: hypothetical protein Q8S36_09120 [Sulfuricurvum sp.]|nr:hypothetical protein [Sulfuricurvum sp.]